MFRAFDFRKAWGCWLFSQNVYRGDIVATSEKRGSGNITLSVDRGPSTDVGSQFPRQTGTVQTMAALTVVG